MPDRRVVIKRNPDRVVVVSPNPNAALHELENVVETLPRKVNNQGPDQNGNIVIAIPSTAGLASTSYVDSQVGTRTTPSVVDSKISTAVAPKADKSYVDSQDAQLQTNIDGKTTSTYVDQQVATRATSAVVDSKISTAIAPKADQSYVDNQVATRTTPATVDSKISTAVTPKADKSYVDSQDSSLSTAIGTKADQMAVDNKNASQDSFIGAKADKTYVDAADQSNASAISAETSRAQAAEDALRTRTPLTITNASGNVQLDLSVSTDYRIELADDVTLDVVNATPDKVTRFDLVIVQTVGNKKLNFSNKFNFPAGISLIKSIAGGVSRETFYTQDGSAFYGGSNIAPDMDLLNQKYPLLSQRPPANQVPRGAFCTIVEINGGTLYRSNGTSWEQIAAGVNQGQFVYVSSGNETKIQAAIDSLGFSGGTVYLGPGNFDINATIKIKQSNTALVGAGWNATQLIGKADITMIDMSGGGSAGGGVGSNVPHFHKNSLRDMTINGGGMDTGWTTAPMVKAYYGDIYWFERCIFLGKPSVLFQCVELWASTFMHCRWDNGSGNDGTKPQFLAVNKDGTTFGDSANTVNDLKFYHCQWEGFRDGGCWFLGDANGGTAVMATMSFNDCGWDSGAIRGPGLKVRRGYGIRIDGCDTSFFALDSGASAVDQFLFQASSMVDIKRTTFNFAGSAKVSTSGINFDGAYTTAGGVSGNTFCVLEDNQGTSNVNGPDALIKISGTASQFRVSSNQWRTLGAAGTPIYSGLPQLSSILQGDLARIKSGSPTDADYGTQAPGPPIDGFGPVIDSNSGRVFYRVNGSWTAGPFADKLATTSAKTAAYTAAAWELVICNPTTQAFTVTLPQSAVKGTMVGVRRVTPTSGANAITIAAGGTETINGSTATQTLPLDNEVILYLSTGAGDWIPAAGNKSLASTDARYLGYQTIEKTDGTVLTARRALKVTGGVTITDDATNGKTIIDVAAGSGGGGTSGPANPIDNALETGTRTAWLTDANSITNNRVVLTYFIASANLTASKIGAVTGANAQAGSTTVRLGIYTVNGAGDVTLVARTAQLSTIFNTASTYATAALDTTGGYPASYAFVAGTRYAIGVIVVGATTTPVIAGPKPPTTGAVGFGISPRIAGRQDSQTDLPTSITVSNITSHNTAYYLTAVV